VRAQTPNSCTLQNLLPNGGFEDGVPGVLPTGWTRYLRYALPSGQVTEVNSYGNSGLISADVAHSGAQSVMYAGTGWQLIENGPEKANTLQVLSAEQYTLSFWAFSTAPNQNIRSEFLKFPCFDKTCSWSGQLSTTNNSRFVQSHSTAAAHSWQQFTHTFTSAESATVRLNIGPNGVSGDHRLYIDDVVVVRRGCQSLPQLLQTACADATTDQLKAAAKAAGFPDMYASFITTCGDTIPKLQSLGYGCTKAEISTACPVTCKTCPTAAPPQALRPSLSAGCIQQTLAACSRNGQLCYCSFNQASSAQDIFALASAAASRCTPARLQEPGMPECMRSVVETTAACAAGGQDLLTTCAARSQTAPSTLNVVALAQCVVELVPLTPSRCLASLYSMATALTQASGSAAGGSTPASTPVPPLSSAPRAGSGTSSSPALADQGGPSSPLPPAAIAVVVVAAALVLVGALFVGRRIAIVRRDRRLHETPMVRAAITIGQAV
jgi:hypothetical protein